MWNFSIEMVIDVAVMYSYYSLAVLKLVSVRTSIITKRNEFNINYR